jgi:uncharacterized protein YijF (DUF1287 family)
MTIFASLALAALLQASPAAAPPFVETLVDAAVDQTRHPVRYIGRGPELEDMLFAFTITGHYRYRGH